MILGNNLLVIKIVFWNHKIKIKMSKLMKISWNKYKKQIYTQKHKNKDRIRFRKYLKNLTLWIKLNCKLIIEFCYKKEQSMKLLGKN